MGVIRVVYKCIVEKKTAIQRKKIFEHMGIIIIVIAETMTIQNIKYLNTGIIRIVITLKNNNVRTHGHQQDSYCC